MYIYIYITIPSFPLGNFSEASIAIFRFSLSTLTTLIKKPYVLVLKCTNEFDGELLIMTKSNIY